MKPRRSRAPISEAHARLGAAMRKARETAGLSTRRMPKDESGDFYSSGHISLAEAGAVAPSLELVDTYARVGGGMAELRSLYQQVTAATRMAGRRRRQGSELDAGAWPPRDALATLDRHEVQEHYVVVSQEAQYSFTGTGAIRALVCTVQLRAKVPGVCLYHAAFAYPTDQRAGVLTVEPIFGATVADLRESVTGAVALYLRLDRDLHPDDLHPYFLSFRVRVGSRMRAAPRLRYFAGVGNERLVVRADYAPAAIPAAIWWFAAADVVDAELRLPGRELEPTDGGSYERTFDRLVPSWCYGFAWNW